MSLRIEELNTPAKLQAAMEAGIARLDKEDHDAVSSFVNATDGMHAALPVAEKAFADIAADLGAAQEEKPPMGAEEIVSLIEKSEE